MLEIRQLCKSYGGRQALLPISFFLPPGQCLGLAGHNGSGKSTLLRLIAQIERPDGGDVRYEGKSVLGDRRFLRGALGYVPQRPELARELTVKQQLELWQAACGLSGPLPEDIAALLGLESLLQKPIRSLSGGMAQRVNIALALLARPKVLLMDEATSGLDQEYVPKLLDWLEAYLAAGGSLIWCSHHQAELERLCGAVLTLEEGRLVSPPETAGPTN
jgi:ABC-2 type transport system ATP-binding protein